MLEPPPRLTVRRRWPRPPAALVARFAGASTCHLADAMDGRGALSHEIKPLAGTPPRFAGPALTCWNAPADNLGLCAALTLAEPGDVVVAATGVSLTTAVAGDIMRGIMKNRSVAAFVTDGLMRDIADLQALGVPSFCAGLSPNSPMTNGPGTVGLPVTIGGVTIAPGDVVVGDPDGVAVVPYAELERIAGRLDRVRAMEAETLAKVRAGLGDVGSIEALTGGAVRYLD